MSGAETGGACSVDVETFGGTGAGWHDSELVRERGGNAGLGDVWGADFTVCSKYFLILESGTSRPRFTSSLGEQGDSRGVDTFDDGQVSGELFNTLILG